MRRTVSFLSVVLAGLAVPGALALTGGRLAAQEQRSAFLIIQLPAQAKLEIEGITTKSTGETRRFQSPPLAVGNKYTYRLKATWNQAGKPVTAERTVSVQAGQEIPIDLREARPAHEAQPQKEPTKVATPKKDETKSLAPFVPTPQEVVEAMLKLAEVKKDDVVYDLGCGDGRIVVTAAKKYGRKKGVGVDFDPERVKESKANAKKEGVEDRVEIRQGDALKVEDIGKATVVTLYLLPDSNLKLRPILQKELKPGSRIVSHDFDMGDWKPLKEESIKDQDGVEHTLYLWQVGGAAAAPKKEAAKQEEPKETKEPDVIYLPTPQGVVDKMLEVAKVKKGDVVYDLGCGDGRIVVTAAKKYGVKAVGFDVNPERIKDSSENVRKNKVEDLVTIKQQDIFKQDLREANVVTLYLLPELNVKLIPQLEKLKPGSRIVSHDFDMKGVKPDQELKVSAKDDDGNEREHTIYLWTTPLKKEKE